MKFNYCPSCGNQDAVKPENLTHYVCKECGWDFWNNPKTAVAIIFLNDKNEILFAKRAREPDKGMYGLPGGFSDYNEDPFEAAIREVKEETDADINREDLVLIASYNGEYIPGVSATDLVMIAKKWQGEFVADDDVAALEWKPISFVQDPTCRLGRFYIGIEEKIADYLSK